MKSDLMWFSGDSSDLDMVLGWSVSRTLQGVMMSHGLRDVLGGRVLAAVMTADVCGDGGRLQMVGLDGFGGILFADEDFQEAEFGLDPLVLPVLLQHRHPVLLLNVSAIMLIEIFLKLSDGLPQFLLFRFGFPQLFQQLWHGRGVGAGQPQIQSELP